MYATPGGPPPQRAFVTPEERAKMRQYGLSVLMQSFANTKFASKLATVVERAEEDAFNKCGNDQGAYMKTFQKKVESSKEGIMKLQQQMHQQQRLAQHHPHPQQAQFPQGGMQHALPPQQQQPQQTLPQVRPQHHEVEPGLAVPEQQPSVEQGDDFNDFLGAFVAPPGLSQAAQQPQQPQQIAQPCFAQQQPQQGVAYPQQNVAAAVQQQQQQAGPAVGRVQQVATVAAAVATVAAAAAQQQQQQMHMAGKMAGMQGNHTGQLGTMQAAAGYPQAMGAAAQMGVTITARATSGQPGFSQAAHGASGVAPAPAGVMGAPGGLAVDQGLAGMYGGGVAVQPGTAAQHGPGGGLMGMPGQQGPGMMGQMTQHQQQHAGVGMAVAGGGGGNVGAGPLGMMGQAAQQQQTAPAHTHAHNAGGTAAPAAAAQVPYGMSQAQQQDMSSYAHLGQQHQLIAQHQAAVAAAAQQAQAVQQQQQQQVAAAAAAQQQQQQQQQPQTAQMLVRAASGGIPTQAAAAAVAAAAAAAAVASRSKTPVVPMGQAVAAAQMTRAQTVPGAAMPGGAAMAAQQPQQQAAQPQQAPPGAVGMQAMGAGAAYSGVPAAAGLASQPIGMATVAQPQPVVPPGSALPAAAGPMTLPQAAATASAGPVAVPAAPTPVPAAPAAGTPAVSGGTHVVVAPDMTPAMVEEYWRVLGALKSRLPLLRAHLDKYSKVAEQQGSDSKASRSKRILIDAYKRCTIDPNSPEYTSLQINAGSLKLMAAVLGSLDGNAHMVRRQGAPAAPGTAEGGAAGVQSAAAVAPHDAAARATATPPQPQPQHPVAAASHVAAAGVKLEGGGITGGVAGAAPLQAVVAVPAAAATNASRAAAAAVMAAAAQNAKLRGIKPNLQHRPMQLKAPGDAAAHGKPSADTDFGGKAALQGRDVKERSGDSLSPAVDQVTRLLGLLAQPLPPATLRVHASRGAADVLNFDWDSLMPSLPAAACCQLTAAAAAATAAAATAGPPRARTVSLCRVAGMSYSDDGGGAEAAAAPADGSTAGGMSSGGGTRAPSTAAGDGEGEGLAAADGGAAGGPVAAALPERKRRREAVEAACQEAQEELGETVALRLLEGGEGEAVVSSSGLEVDAWLLECEAAVALERAGEDESRGASGGAAGHPWKRLRMCVPWDYPEVAPIPTFASTDAAYTHPYGRAARLHFQTALQSGHVPLQLSIRTVAKAWRDAVTRVCGAVRTADAVAGHTVVTPAAVV
ncbi:hypothetical protein PLESTF_001394500 [Pleodorina starrii]|nr:hypothetical protein PLESTF_001394500 [Pleodorina starrii]